jgi:hypothetical protein
MKAIPQTINLFFLSSALLCAQNAITSAGPGYRTPLPSVDVAPGQLIVLHVNGISTNIDSNVVAAPNPLGFPTTLNGISADLVQGNPATTTSLGLRALYQTNCIPADACNRVTGITLQIPFELDSDYAAKGNTIPVIHINENGKRVGGVALRPVSDNVHVLNTCDDTQVYVSAAYSVPQNICTPVVMVGNQLNSLYNLAHGGDVLLMWVYGMGASTPTPPNCCNDPSQLPRPLQSFQLNFDFRPNVPASPAVAGFGVTAAPAAVAFVGGGMYQVNFTVPPVPAGTPACDGVKIKSNLTVTVTGPNSYDAALLCVGQ